VLAYRLWGEGLVCVADWGGKETMKGMIRKGKGGLRNRGEGGRNGGTGKLAPSLQWLKGDGRPGDVPS